MHLDCFVAGPGHRGSHRLRVALAIAAALTGCASTSESLRENPGVVVETATPVPAPIAVAIVSRTEPEPLPAQARPAEEVLAYADRVRSLPPPDLAQEITRLGDGGDSAVRLMELAIALAQTRVPANSLRAQALLQRVLGQNQPEARALHPLARLMAPQLAETRRAEEQVERQAQQLRDAQRRIDQLNERLEAVRTIERSLPSVPATGASGPAAPRP